MPHWPLLAGLMCTGRWKNFNTHNQYCDLTDTNTKSTTKAVTVTPPSANPLQHGKILPVPPAIWWCDRKKLFLWGGGSPTVLLAPSLWLFQMTMCKAHLHSSLFPYPFRTGLRKGAVNWKNWKYNTFGSTVNPILGGRALFQFFRLHTRIWNMRQNYYSSTHHMLFRSDFHIYNDSQGLGWGVGERGGIFPCIDAIDLENRDFSDLIFAQLLRVGKFTLPPPG